MKEYFYFRTYSTENSGNDYRMYITPDGVSLVYRNGKMLDTDIIPSKIHPGKDKLTRKEIEDLHRFIKYNDYKNGKLYSKTEFNKIKNEYKTQFKDKAK